MFWCLKLFYKDIDLQKETAPSAVVTRFYRYFPFYQSSQFPQSSRWLFPIIYWNRAITNIRSQDIRVKCVFYIWLEYHLPATNYYQQHTASSSHPSYCRQHWRVERRTLLRLNMIESSLCSHRWWNRSPSRSCRSALWGRSSSRRQWWSSGAAAHRQYGGVRKYQRVSFGITNRAVLICIWMGFEIVSQFEENACNVSASWTEGRL